MRHNLHLVGLVTLAAAVLGIMAGGAQAQTEAQAVSDPIANCRAEASDAARIACLEREIEALRSVRDGGAAPLGLSDPLAGPHASGVTPLAPGSGGSGQGAVRAASITPVAPPQLGDEQVFERQERRKPKNERKIEQIRQVDSRLIDYAYTANGRLLLVLENGQVWIQLSGDVAKPILRKSGGYEVSIRRGAISGYRLTIADVTIAVERLK